jgi:hypothetical protein
MLYRLLGVVVWRVARLVLRRRWRSLPAARRMGIAGAALAAAAGALAAAARRGR